MKKTTQVWEKEFDKLGRIWFDTNGMELAKDFIRSLLSSQKQSLKKKVEGKKKRLYSLKKRIREGSITATEIASLREFEVPFKDGYNQAISDILKLLEEC